MQYVNFNKSTKPSLKDYLHLIKVSWHEVLLETIGNFRAHTGLE